MAFDEGLAQRIREALDERPGLTEKRMFGGICFLVDGNMACGVVGDELMVRVGPDAYAEALARPHAREMDFSGRPMRGLVYVGRAGIRSDEQLRAWVLRGLEFSAEDKPGFWEFSFEDVFLTSNFFWHSFGAKLDFNVWVAVLGNVLGLDAGLDFLEFSPFQLEFDPVPKLGSFVVYVAPEPGTGSLVGGALLALAASRRRRWKAPPRHSAGCSSGSR